MAALRRLNWLSKFEVVKRNHRVQHHDWECAMEASEAKMRKLQAQILKKQDLYQQKRDIINDYSLRSERDEKVRERLKRPNSAPGLDGTWAPLSLKAQQSASNLALGRPIDAPVDVSAGRESRLAELMSGGSGSGFFGGREKSGKTGSKLTGKLEQSLALGNWVI